MTNLIINFVDTERLIGGRHSDLRSRKAAMITLDARIDLSEQSDIAALTALVSVSGLNLVDVGCGPALTSRALVQMGAHVAAVEPDPVQAEMNLQAEPNACLVYHQCSAERLPMPDHSVDGVLFFRSLHHVPVDEMDNALQEAVRVLKPISGFLWVVEPGMTGSNFQLMRPFHDETRVRTEAQAALARFSARNLFRNEAHYQYVQHPRHASFEEMVARVTSQTFNAITREMVENEEVRTLFEKGRTSQGDYTFEQPMLLNFYRGLA
ncbi:MAG: class I SAM-dependent methyltransferase [Sphingorhabdus sp.]